MTARRLTARKRMIPTPRLPRLVIQVDDPAPSDCSTDEDMITTDRNLRAEQLLRMSLVAARRQYQMHIQSAYDQYHNLIEDNRWYRNNREEIEALINNIERNI